MDACEIFIKCAIFFCIFVHCDKLKKLQEKLIKQLKKKKDIILLHLISFCS